MICKIMNARNASNTINNETVIMIMIINQRLCKTTRKREGGEEEEEGEKLGERERESRRRGCRA